MGLLANAVAMERKAGNSVYDELRNMLMGMAKAKSGASVNLDTALRVSTVLACARVRAQGLAQVPLKLFLEAADGSKRAAREHPLYYVLHTQPNEWQTSYEYMETLGLHHALAGRHYAFKNVVKGRVAELIPFEPNKVVPRRLDDGSLVYKVSFDNGTSKDFPQAAIWHVKGLSWNGWQGLDALQLAREAVGLAISAEEQHAELFKNGISTNGTYSVEGSLNPKQYAELRAFLKENYSGANKGLPMIVDRGAKWLQQGQSGIDAQHMEVRRFQVEEVCRGMGVLPIMVGHADKTATYASAEQMFLAHVVYTLSPLYASVEQSINVNLLGRAAIEQGYYVKFIVAALLRGSMKDKGDYYAKALGAGGSPAWHTQDEIRALEEYNPMGGKAGELPEVTNAPAAADPAEKSQRDEMHRSTVDALKRGPPSPNITIAQPVITIQPGSVKAGDVHFTLPEGAIQVHTTVEPAQIKAGDVHIAATENHINVPHPKKSATHFERDPTTLELKRSETTYEAD